MKILNSSIIIFLLILVYSCKKERDITSYHSCESNNIKIKDFEIFERVADTLLPTDVALTSGSVTFKASEKYDSVKWKIGNDLRVFKEKNFSLIFDDPEIIKVELIGFIGKQYHCKGKRIDTIVKQLQIKPYRNSLLTGQYKGVRISNPTDSFIVEIKQTNDPSWLSDYFIYNFPKGCNARYPPYPENIGYLINAGAKNLRIRNDLPAIQECLFEVYGVGKLKGEDSLFIDFNYRPLVNNSQIISDKFIGKKL